MVTFEQFKKKFDTLPTWLPKEGAKVVMKQKTKIVELNNSQLLSGKNIDNEIMQSGYSTAYGRRRQKKGLQTAFVDLKFTGKYQDSRKAVKAAGGVNIQSGVDYEKYLRGNFEGHVGLTEENAEVIAEAALNDIAKMIKNYLIT
jgi:hypothetical protein